MTTAKPKTERQLLNPGGRPWKFATEMDFMEAFVRYIEHCSKANDLPNISGFAVFNDMSKDTFYQQAERFPDAYKKVRDALEDRLQNYHHYQSNPAMAIVQGKNTFKWDDRAGQQNSGDMVEIDLNDDDIDILLSKMGYSLLE